ncbi:GNAT family N-acetyltransferase [Balneola sp. MJW-20]|uniref:GNAT family N-acetyltransferase n=1 Tax=Gracilimonas aurantiaca TaxID=3234185 RepID=UPI0034674557
MSIRFKKADLNNDEDCRNIIEMTDHYAQDPMGGGQPLPDEVRKNLIRELKEMEGEQVYLGRDESGKTVAIANCFISFSTFLAGKTLYVHDLAVHEEYRSRGIGQQMLDFIEDQARKLGCKAITLEVLENNPARKLYERNGFKIKKPFYLFARKTL